MSKLESKILQLEREAEESDAAYRTLRRAYAVDCYERASRQGEAMANLLRAAADARQQACELRARLPSGHALYRAPAWQQTRWRSLYAA